MADPGDAAPNLGFKELTRANWIEADPVNRNFARLSPLVGPVQMGEDDWVREILAVELDDRVPGEIADLYAIARGAMLYGWFFYPIFRLAEEQLYRVLEAAAKMRYRQAQGPKRRPSYNETISYLREVGLIPSGQLERWHAARKLRNMASHPERATVVPPGFAVRMLRVAANDIDALFATAKAPEDGA